MNTKQDFIQLLKNSGLAPERQSYWLQKIESGNLTEQDQVEFINEMEEHLANLNLKILDKKNDLKAKQEEAQQLQNQLEPVLASIEEENEPLFKENVKAYKEQVFKLEGEALNAIEAVRRDEEAAQIAQLKGQFT